MERIVTTYSRFVLIFPFPFSGTGECTHAHVVSFMCVLLLEAQQEQTSKLRIFLIKLSHSSSTYENTFTFQHFSDRPRAITFGLKEHENKIDEREEKLENKIDEMDKHNRDFQIQLMTEMGDLKAALAAIANGRSYHPGPSRPQLRGIDI